MSDTPLTPNRFCLGCGYSLRGLIDPRCPECGREFDPNDPKTWSPRPLPEERVSKVTYYGGEAVFWGCVVPIVALFFGAIFFAAWVTLWPLFKPLLGW